MLAKKRTLLWSNEGCADMTDETMPFDGIPYFVLGKKIYKCRLGKRKLRKVCQSISTTIHFLFSFLSPFPLIFGYEVLI